jgi:GT2 family glycosyltransferase
MTAAVIVNWNGGEYLVACLESVLAATRPKGGLKVYVVDNGSTDGSVEMVENQFPEIKLIKNGENLGFAEGNNVGLRQALKDGAECLVVLNNDTQVESQLFVGLLSAVKEKVGIVSPKIYFAPGREFHYHRYQESERGKVIWYAGGIIDWQNVLSWHRGINEVDQGQFDRTQKTEFATGCCMLLTRKVAEGVGFFDPAYFAYWEDNDLCQRAKRAGFKIIYEPQGRLWHFNAGSSGGPGSKIHQYYLTRNRLIFGLRYAPWRAKFALAKESLKFMAGGGVRQKAVVDFWIHHWGKGGL